MVGMVVFGLSGFEGVFDDGMSSGKDEAALAAVLREDLLARRWRDGTSDSPPWNAAELQM